MFESQLHPLWRSWLADELELLEKIEQSILLDSGTIPASENILRAFGQDPGAVRVLIVGQDPYPNPAHATGLSFAVPEGVTTPPASLRNILKELRGDLGEGVGLGTDISIWAHRGVMLLNRHLTTSQHETLAHADLGWDLFTTAAIRELAQQKGKELVAILWGNKAQELRAVLGSATVISSAHPSPLSAHRGFFGSKPFSRCNEALVELGLEPIDWSL